MTDQLRHAAERDTEPYREGCKLTDKDLPNSVLAHLDHQWSQRQTISGEHLIAAETPPPKAVIDLTEKIARENVALAAMRKGYTVLSCSVAWTQRRFGADPGRPWQPGTPLTDGASLAVVTATGVAVRMLDAEPRAIEDDNPLFLFRCTMLGCEHTQHSVLSVTTLREHNTDHARCPGSGQLASARVDLSGRQR